MQFDCTLRGREGVGSVASNGDPLGYQGETVLATQEYSETLPAPVPLFLREALAAAIGIQARSLPAPDHPPTLDARIPAIWAKALDLPPPERLRVANLLVAALQQLVAGGVGRGC